MSDRLVRRRQLLSPSLGSLFLSLSLSEARALVCRAACVRARVFRTRLSLELVLLCCLSQTLRSCILQSVWPSSRVWLEVSSQQLIFFSPTASLVCPKADFVNDFFSIKTGIKLWSEQKQPFQHFGCGWLRRRRRRQHIVVQLWLVSTTSSAEQKKLQRPKDTLVLFSKLTVEAVFEFVVRIPRHLDDDHHV